MTIRNKYTSSYLIIIIYFTFTLHLFNSTFPFILFKKMKKNEETKKTGWKSLEEKGQTKARCMGVEGTSSGTPRIVCVMYGLGLDTTNLYIYIHIYLCIFNVCIALSSSYFLSGRIKKEWFIAGCKHFGNII